MPISIQVVNGARDLKSFVKLPFRLLGDNPCWVPPVISEELKVLDPAKNPCQRDAPSRLFLARRDGEVVGRVAAILSRPANRIWGEKNLRFGWFDCVQDLSVARALFEKVEEWGRELGMETLTGPQGFTDMDPEGMLVEGYEHLATIATIYNPPYYPELMEQLGFSKEVDYIEFRSFRPEGDRIDPKVLKLGQALLKRSKLTVRPFRDRREVKEMVPQILETINEAYAEIYGFVPLSQDQFEFYVKRFLDLADLDLVFLALDPDGRMVGFGTTLPNLSKALQKARGRLLPWGWYHLLKGMREREVLDLYLLAVRKAYQGGGVPLLMLLNMLEKGMAKGYQCTESNPMLEHNKLMQGMHKYFDHITHKRRRVYKKSLAI
jgi:GNAT superfamily N-acetyltransferase